MSNEQQILTRHVAGQVAHKSYPSCVVGQQTLPWIPITKAIKGIVSDSNNIFLWHESENINKKAYFQNFS